MLRYARWKARLLNRPAMILPETAEVILSLFAPRLGVGEAVVLENGIERRIDLRAGSEDGPPDPAFARPRRAYAVEDGIATVPVTGELVNRAYGLDPASALSSYEAIGRAVEQAASDRDVRGILLDLDSPGGEIGAVDLGRRVRAAAAAKPVWAVVDSLAASAGYAVAAGAKRVLAPADAEIGSIGVIGLHADMSEALAGAGLKVTVIKAGAFKDDGSPFRPLDEGARARWEKAIGQIYGSFVKQVSDLRGIAQRDVRATEAGVFLAGEAKALGLVDDVLPAHEARAAFAEFVNNRGRSRTAKGTGMEAVRADAAENAAVDSENVERRLAEARRQGDPLTRAGVAASLGVPLARLEEDLRQADHGGAAAAARREGAALERARVAAILRHEHAEGRGPVALSLALDTDLPAEQAVKVMQAMPRPAAPPAAAAEAEAKAPAGLFETGMARLGNPQVGADEPEADALDGLLTFSRKFEGGR